MLVLPVVPVAPVWTWAAWLRRGVCCPAHPVRVVRSPAAAAVGPTAPIGPPQTAPPPSSDCCLATGCLQVSNEVSLFRSQSATLKTKQEKHVKIISLRCEDPEIKQEKCMKIASLSASDSKTKQEKNMKIIALSSEDPQIKQEKCMKSVSLSGGRP